MEETENFRIHIREIQLNTEMEIVNAILDHYRPVFRRLCERNKLFIKTRQTISLPLHRNFQRIDQPILKFKEDLKQKRTKKISNSQTHIQRGQLYATKKPKQKYSPDQNSIHHHHMIKPMTSYLNTNHLDNTTDTHLEDTEQRKETITNTVHYYLTSNCRTNHLEHPTMKTTMNIIIIEFLTLRTYLLFYFIIITHPTQDINQDFIKEHFLNNIHFF